MSTKAASKTTKNTKGKEFKSSSKNKVNKVEVSESESDNEEDMGDKPKPLTLKFRGRNANKSGELDLLLKIVNLQADELSIDGQNRNQALNTFLGPITDDEYETLEAHLKKCKKGDKKKKDKFIAKDEDGKPLKGILNSYQLFCRDERPKIKAANPEISNTEMLSVLGASWNKLAKSKKTSDKKRHQKYIDLNAKLKMERAKLIESLQKKAIENGEFEEPKPKRPMSAYFIFIHSEEMKQDIVSNRITRDEMSKYKSNKWAKLSEEGQKPYYERAELAKKQYEKEIIAWQKRCAKRKKKAEESEDSNDNSSGSQIDESTNQSDGESDHDSDNGPNNDSDNDNESSDED